MTGQSGDDDAAALRARAELSQARTTPATKGVDAHEGLRLVHELQVHQIELQMQNEALRESRSALEVQAEGYRELYDFAPVGYITLSPAGAILRSNLTAATLFGSSRADIMGRSFRALVLPASVPAFNTFLAQVLSQDDKGPLDVALMRADGSTVWCRLDGARHGQTGNVNATLTDISDRVHAETSLRAAEEFTRAALDALSAHVAIIDDTGTILHVNTAWLAFARENDGVLPLVGVGANYLDTLASPSGEQPNDGPSVRNGIVGVLSGRQPEFVFEYPCHSPTTQRWFTARVTRFEEHGASRAIIAHQNISDRVSLETQLLQSQKMETVGRLAGGIAHDFNNLLTIIAGNTELARTSAVVAADATLNHDLREVSDAATRAAALTRQLLAFSRQQLMAFQPVDLTALVDNLRDLVQRLIGPQIQHVVVRDARPCGIVADPVQIEQIIMNLIVNARDAMPDGGTLTIGVVPVELDAHAASEHTGLHEGPYVALTVQDTGVGMSDATLRRIFEPFFTTKPADKGSGLGLSTVYGIVNQSHGSIRVASQLGGGSVFTALFPRSDSIRTGTTPLEDIAHAEGKETILVVEDEAAIRRLSERILRGAGYTVFTAGNGVEALAFLSQHSARVDLLLTDVLMPMMGGVELATAARRLRPGTRVLFASGFSDAAIPGGTSPDDATHFIAKPYSSQQLTAIVRSALDAPQVSASATESTRLPKSED